MLLILLWKTQRILYSIFHSLLQFDNCLINLIEYLCSMFHNTNNDEDTTLQKFSIQNWRTDMQKNALGTYSPIYLYIFKWFVVSV